MQFYIEQLVLWPIDDRKPIHTLEFHNGKINIIHGRSGTGKSSIIAIIDYCLGASRCAIPVGLIRDKVDWFGLVINVRGYKVLVARRTPGERQASNELFLKQIEDVLPIKPNPTHKLDKFKNAFNNLVQLTNLTLAEGENIGFDGRPSYRDLAAFNFLPQHIVANPNTLFYKADSYEHKERLTRVMPLALGIISSEYLVKERERSQLQKQHDSLLKQQEVRRRAISSWNADVENLWLQSIEIGLANEGQAETIEKKISILQKIHSLYLENKLDEILQAPDYLSINQKFSELKTQEEELQKSTDALKREIRGYEQMARRATAFTEAVNLEKNRVVNLDWLKRKLTSENECIVCGSQTNQLDHVISHLETEMGRVNRLSQALFENPIVDKEIESAKSKLFELQNQLHTVCSSRLNLEKMDSTAKDSLNRIHFLMGLIQSLLKSFAEMNNADDTGKQIAELAEKTRELDEYFRSSGKAARQDKVDNELSGLIELYADGFNLEKRGLIRLDKKELTLSFQGDEKSKKEYLWEVGSGANWMGYHIATFLAIHQFLSKAELSNSPVFNFLVIDQPSQVYFPTANSGANQLDVGDENTLKTLIQERDVDVSATKRIFEMLNQGLNAADYRYQIIVLEHADNSIWGEIPNAIEVASWKAEGQGLIPQSWLD